MDSNVRQKRFVEPEDGLVEPFDDRLPQARRLVSEAELDERREDRVLEHILEARPDLSVIGRR